MTIRFDSDLGISASGNIQGAFIKGDGSQLTNIPAGNVNLTAVTTDIIPVGNNLQSLGNATHQWQDLWVSNSTIYFNSVPLSVGVGNTLTIGNSTVVTTSGAGNTISATDISVTGSVTAGFLYGDGSGLTNLPVSDYSNANVASYLPTYSGALTAATVTATGNISGSYILGNGSQLTGLPATYGNSNVASYLPTDSTIISIQDNASNTNSNVANLSTSVTGIATDLGNTNSNVANTDSNVSVLSNAVASLSGNVYGNAQVASYLPFNPTIISIQSSLSNTNSNVSNVASDVTVLQGNVVSLSGAVANTDSNVSNLSTTVTGITGNVTTLQGNVISLTGALSNTNSNISDLSNIVASNSTDIISLQGQVYANANVAAYFSNSATTGSIYATDITASNTVTATTFIGNFQGNITGNLVVPGSTGWVIYNNDGNAGADVGFQYNVSNKQLSVTGNIISNAYVFGNAAFMTGIPTAYGNANVANYLPTDSTIISLTGDISNTNSNVANTDSNVANTDSNVATLTTSVSGITSALGNTNSNVSTLNTQVTSLTGKVYTNANVAAYLPSYNGNIGVAGITSINGGNSQFNIPAVVISTNNEAGGPGYAGLIEMINTTANATGNSKTVRLSDVGNLQIIDSGYATTIMNLDDFGNVIFAGNISTGQYLHGNGAFITGLPAGYSNADVAAYLPTDSTIISIQGNASNTNSNVSNLSTSVTGIASNLSNTNSNVANLSTSVTGIASDLGNTNSNVSNLSTSVTGIASNLGNLTTSVTGIASDLGNTNANVSNVANTAANNASNITTLQGQVTSLTGNVYGNANVAAYLPTYTGNLTANVISAGGNITGVSLNLDGGGEVYWGYGSYIQEDGASHGLSIVGATALTLKTSGTSSGNINLTTDGGTAVYDNAGNLTLPNSVGVTTDVSAGGNVTAANFTTSGSGGNIFGANVVSAVTFTATGNVYANNISAGGDVDANNFLTAGVVSAGGNVTGDYIIGDGSQLTNLPGSNNQSFLANSTATFTLLADGTLLSGTVASPANFKTSDTYTPDVDLRNSSNTGMFTQSGDNVTVRVAGSKNWVFDSSGNLSAQGNINAVGNINSANVNVQGTNGNLTLGDATATASPGLSSASSLTLTSNRYVDAQSIVFGTDGNLIAPGAISASGNVTGNYILGNGSLLSNLPGIQAESPFNIITSDFNATVGSRYGIDTTGGGWIATLPATPATGDAIFFADAGGNFSGHAFVVNPGSNTIMGAPGSMTVTTNGQSFGLFWNGSTWRTYN